LRGCPSKHAASSTHALCAGPARIKASRARAALDGFPSPSEDAAHIVSVLQKAGDVFQLLPPTWEEELALPRDLFNFATVMEGGVLPAPPTKKRRRAGHHSEGSAPSAAVETRRASQVPERSQHSLSHATGNVSAIRGVSALSEMASPSEGARVPTAELAAQAAAGASKGPMPGQHPPMQDARVYGNAGAESCREASRSHAGDMPGSKEGERRTEAPQVCPHGSSTSDEANNTRFIPSPDGQGSENVDGKADAGPGSLATGRHTRAAGPAKASISCQAGPGMLISPGCLEPAAMSAAAAALSSITPFDMLMPKYARTATASVTDKLIEDLINKARGIKHAADRKRGGVAAPWTVATLCMYIDSAITFMETCEYMARAKAMARSRQESADKSARLVTLYCATSKLLEYTRTSCESAQGIDLSREALRLLVERLCSICLAKEAYFGRARLSEASNQAASLSKSVQSAGASANGRQSHHGGVHRASAVVTDDSTNSSPAASGAMPALPLPSGDGLAKLLDHARGVSKFAGLLRRTTLGFQSFVERPDLRGSQPSKLASMHIAALSTDAGMGDGFRVLNHARQAVSNIQTLCR